MTYNLSNVTASNNFGELVVNNVQLVPQAGVFILISFIVIVFISLNGKMFMERAALVATFLGMIIGWFFYFINLISLDTFKVVALLFVVLLAVNVFGNRG